VKTIKEDLLHATVCCGIWVLFGREMMIMLLLFKNFLRSYCDYYPNFFLLPTVHMKKSHFAKDLTSYNAAGLLRYIQPTLAEFRHCIETYTDEPIMPPVLILFSLFYIGNLLLILWFSKIVPPVSDSSDSEGPDDDGGAPPGGSSAAKRARYEANLTTDTITPHDTSGASVHGDAPLGGGSGSAKRVPRGDVPGDENVRL